MERPKTSMVYLRWSGWSDRFIANSNDFLRVKIAVFHNYFNSSLVKRWGILNVIFA
jgi:hypothetical protein